jgi:glycogen synthase
MRILLVSQQYPPETASGGIGTQTHAKAHGLAARGHQVQVLAHAAGANAERYHDGLVEVRRIPGLDHRLAIGSDLARWLTWSSEVAVAIGEVERESPLDLIEFPEWGCEGLVHLLNRVDRAGSTPVVIQLHGPLVMMAHALGWPSLDSDLYRVGSVLEGTCLRLADAVYSSSRCSIDWCARHHGLDPNGVPVLHTGVDTTLFRPNPEARERRTVVFAGRIAENKGVRTLVRACAALRREFPDLRLLLIGGGGDGLLRSLRAEAARAPGGDLLETTGFVPSRRLARELVRGEVFAAPSIYEAGPGLVYLEAMACGLPVVACSGSGAAEGIIPGETGLLVAPSDHDDLCGALARLLRDDELRRDMGRRAREHVLATASTGDRLDAIEAFLVSVASRCAEARG